MDDVEAGEGLVFLLLIAAVAYVVYHAVKGTAGAVTAAGQSVVAGFSATPAPGAVTPSNPSGGSYSLGFSDWLWKITHPNDPYNAPPGVSLPSVSGPGRGVSTPVPDLGAGSAIEADFGISGNNASSSSWDDTLTP